MPTLRASRRTLAAGLLLAAGGALAATPAAALSWRPLGPDGGGVSALAVHPSDPSVVYGAASDAGLILRSVDGGVTFELLPGSAGLLAPLNFIQELAFDAGGTLFVVPFGEAPGRSPDGGETWTALAAPPPRPGEDFPPRLNTLAAHPSIPGRLYAGTSRGVYRTDDAGASFEPLNGPPGPIPEIPFSSVEALVLDPDQPSTLWAAVTSGGVFRSTDGGDSWQPANGGLSGQALSVTSLAVLPRSPTTLIAGTFGGIFRSVDGGDSWQPAAGVSGGFFIEAPAVDPDDPDQVWIKVSGELYTSADGGVSFQEVSGLPAGNAVAAPLPGGPEVVVGANEGVFRSEDGVTWVSGPEVPALRVTALSAHPDHPGELLAGTADGLFRRDSAGAPWQRVLELGPTVDLLRSAAHPDTAFAWHLNVVHRSDDGGASWGEESVASAGNPFIISGFWIDPSDPARLYSAETLTLLFSGFPSRLLKSTDGGDTWQEIWGLEPPVFHDLAVDPFDSNNLLLSRGFGVARSANGGATWTSANAGLGVQPLVVDIEADPSLPGRYLAQVSERGLFVSADGGRNWSPAGAGLPAVPLGGISFNRSRPGHVDVATAGGQVFNSTDGGLHWFPFADPLPDRLPAGPLTRGPGGALYAATRSGVWVTGADTSPCVADEVTLCLAGGRFEVHVDWQDFQGGFGPGHAVPLTGDTGAFWFFRDTNVELAVKVLDGRFVNGFWWVFYGSLSNVPFNLTVRNTENCDQRVYPNAPRTFASRGDTRGFPAPVPAFGAGAGAVRGVAGPPAGAAAGPLGAGASAESLGTGRAAGSPGGELLALLPAEPPPGTATAAGTSGGSCLPSDTALCLGGGRFRVEVEWEDFQGGSGAGHTHPLTGDTGAFWFFRESNLELFVKVLDGRAVNDRWWVFYGSLSNVPFSLRVTDTVTGAPRIYENPPRSFASRGDTTAF